MLNALPFMLDLMRIPAGLYQLHLVTGMVNGRIATRLAGMNLLVFTLLMASTLAGYLNVNRPRATIALIRAVALPRHPTWK